MVETRAQHRRRVTSQTWGKVEGAEDVFHDILSRLSVRSIRSFKTVNRYWHASISNKHFATKQLAQSRKKPSYIACPRADKAMKLYLLKPGKFNYRHHATVDPPGRSADHNMHMIASFNGLVCCINQLSDENEEDFQIWICNPSTEQTLLLPQGRPSFWTEPSIGVAYGPDMSEYKIFRIVSDGENGAGLHIECEVYSSSTGAWRIIGAVPHLPMYVFLTPHRSSHVFVGGKIYWLVSLEDPGIILYVDMEERFGVMELPYYSPDIYIHKYIRRLNHRYRHQLHHRHLRIVRLKRRLDLFLEPPVVLLMKRRFTPPPPSRFFCFLTVASYLQSSSRLSSRATASATSSFINLLCLLHR